MVQITFFGGGWIPRDDDGGQKKIKEIIKIYKI